MVPQQERKTSGPAGRCGKRLVVIGAGNIGSYCIGLLGRIQGVERITLVDGDIYQSSNLSGQDIQSRDVGKWKVLVQANRLRGVNPHLEVRAIGAWVQDVPRGLLRSDVIITCLDSRSARQITNELAWRLAVPWVDSGVDAAGLLARVNVYIPAPGASCIECAWNDDDYEELEQSYACLGSGSNRAGAQRPVTTATNAPASLGSIAAGLVATECEKLLDGDYAHLAQDKQVLVDCRHHKCLVTRYAINKLCRFDHAIWSTDPIPWQPARISVGDFCDWVAGSRGPGTLELGLEGHSFVHRLVCGQCGELAKNCLYLSRRTPPSRSRCTACGQPLVASGFHTTDSLLCGSLSGAQRRRSMSSVGFRHGDIVTVRAAGGEHHYEFAISPPREPDPHPRSSRSCGHA